MKTGNSFSQEWFLDFLALANTQPGSEGTSENSPAFQRRVEYETNQVPQGRLTVSLPIQLSLRDLAVGWPIPGVETPGYFRQVPSGLDCC